MSDKIKSFGETARDLRESKGLLLRQVAAFLYDYALSTVLLFQFHDHICKKILKQDVHAANYYGSKETGNFPKEMMKPGAGVDWRELLKNTTGAEMNAKPMQDYFAPLTDYLKKVNTGRRYTHPEKI